MNWKGKKNVLTVQMQRVIRINQYFQPSHYKSFVKFCIIIYNDTKGLKNMAKSKARKIREKAIREGKRDVITSRGSWNGVNPLTRITLTKQETIRKTENKHKKRNLVSNRFDGQDFASFIKSSIALECLLLLKLIQPFYLDQ